LQAIALGLHSLVVTGGMESMSNIPHYAPTMRRGVRLGHATLLDGLLHDGLTDAKYGVHMGECAESCAAKQGITREQQDAHAIESVRRAREAMADGLVGWEIAPVERPAGRGAKGTGSAGGPTSMTEDEAVAKMDPDKLRRLPAYFKPDNGTVTAGNASPITDGAAALVLASQEAVDRLALRPLGRILGFADAAQDPMDFPTAPSLAVPKALRHAGISHSEVDYWEINEAFSVVDLANQKILGLDPSRVNVFGGAVAIGHPIGASGARLILTLLNVLRVKGGKVGVAAICNGGGGASAIVVESLNVAAT
jgi:acetyl-CoA C-acetyltransferase